MSISLSIACPEDGVIHDKRIMCRNVQVFFIIVIIVLLNQFLK